MPATAPLFRPSPLLGLLIGLFLMHCTVPADRPHAPQDARQDVMYQVGTLTSLLEGEFESPSTIGDLTQRGTLGLGTVNRLDGEMVIVGGTAYAIRNDGSVDTLDEATGTPFGIVTPFEVDTTLTLRDVDGFSAFQSQLDEAQPATSSLYAFRATGAFDSLQTRSVPAQQPPYPTLEEVIATQTRFPFRNTSGTLVGVRIPAVFDGVNAVGHHAHFITARRSGGGHVLDLHASELTVQIDRSSSLQVNPHEP